MNQGKLLKYMASMIKLSRNMEAQLHGNTLMKLLIIYLLVLLLMAQFSASMEVYLQKLRQLIK